MKFQITHAEPGLITLAILEEDEEGRATVKEYRTLTDEEALDFMHTNNLPFHS